MVLLQDVGRNEVATACNTLIGQRMQGEPDQRIVDLTGVWWPRPLSMIETDCDLDIALQVVTEDVKQKRK